MYAKDQGSKELYCFLWGKVAVIYFREYIPEKMSLTFI